MVADIDPFYIEKMIISVHFGGNEIFIWYYDVKFSNSSLTSTRNYYTNEPCFTKTLDIYVLKVCGECCRDEIPFSLILNYCWHRLLFLFILGITLLHVMSYGLNKLYHLVFNACDMPTTTAGPDFELRHFMH